MKIFSLAFLAGLAVAGYLAYISYPDVLRYLRMREM